MKKIAITLATLALASSTFAFDSEKHQLSSQTQSLIFNIHDVTSAQDPNSNRLCIYHLNHADEKLEEFKSFVNLTGTQAKFASKVISTMFEVYDEDFDEQEMKKELVDDAQKHVHYAERGSSCEHPEKIADITRKLTELKARL